MRPYEKIWSIPTVYNGIEFRSRFEAETAQWLDKKKWTWEYEPRSFLLPSGIHFMPDFYLPEKRYWIECRGYVTEKGEAQILEFPLVMPPTDILVVLRPGGEAVYENVEVHLHESRLAGMWKRVWEALSEEDSLARSNFFYRYCDPEFMPEELR